MQNKTFIFPTEFPILDATIQTLRDNRKKQKKEHKETMILLAKLKSKNPS